MPVLSTAIRKGLERLWEPAVPRWFGCGSRPLPSVAPKARKPMSQDAGHDEKAYERCESKRDAYVIYPSMVDA